MQRHEHAPINLLEMLREHRRLRVPVWQQIRKAGLLVVLTAPLIYACLIPFLWVDLFVSVYQWVCFPIYGIPKVRRRDHLIFDRGKLQYLNGIERMNCVYCSYANGLLGYVTEIAGRTEQYFCPIRHAREVARPHSRYSHFLPYGNGRAYRAHAEKVSRAYGDVKGRHGG